MVLLARKISSLLPDIDSLKIFPLLFDVALYWSGRQHCTGFVK